MLHRIDPILSHLIKTLNLSPELINLNNLNNNKAVEPSFFVAALRTVIYHINFKHGIYHV